MQMIRHTVNDHNQTIQLITQKTKQLKIIKEKNEKRGTRRRKVVKLHLQTLQREASSNGGGSIDIDSSSLPSNSDCDLIK